MVIIFVALMGIIFWKFTTTDKTVGVVDSVSAPVAEETNEPTILTLEERLHDELSPVVLEKDGYRIVHPKALTQEYNMYVTTIAERRAELEKYRANGGCPGRCGELLADPELYEKQFTMLEQSTQCGYTESYKEDIKKHFRLFSYAIGGPEYVREVYNEDLGVCGFVTVGFSGYDVSVGNFYYSAKFVVGEEVVALSFQLLPRTIFSDVDEEIYYSKDFDEFDYYQNKFSYDNDIVLTMISRYDAIVASLEKI